MLLCTFTFDGVDALHDAAAVSSLPAEVLILHGSIPGL
jgi:hypothetical protein